MPRLRIETTEGVLLEREIAGAGARSAACIIDMMLLISVFLAAALTVTLLGSLDGTGIGKYLAGFMAGGAVLLMVTYFTWIPILMKGRTPGKAMLGLRVTGDSGYAPSAGQHLLRSLLFVVEFALWFPLPVGLYVIALTPQRRRLGDMVAGTLVLYDPEPDSEEPWARYSWSGLEQRSLELERSMSNLITDEEFDHLRRVITRRGLDQLQRRKLLVRTARYFAKKLELGSFDDARSFLRELYLFVREVRQARAE